MTHTTHQPLPRPDTDASLFAAYPRRRAIVHLSYKGVALDLELADVDTKAIETLITGLLARDGWQAATPTMPVARAESRFTGRNTTKAPRVQPVFDGDGQACCPQHKRPLKDGQWGRFCSAKDADGNYCKLKFVED